MGRFFGLSFMLHLCSALLFVAYADRALSKYHQEVLYIDLSQSLLPTVTRPEIKPKSEAVKQHERAPIPVPPVKKERPPQTVKASSPPMQQTPISDSVKPAPINNSEQVTAASQESTTPSAAWVANSQLQGSMVATSTSGHSANSRLVGEVAFGSASGPSFLQRVLPKYPLVARRFNKEGKVVLRLTINEYGSLTDIEILEDPGFGLASAAVEAVKKSRYNPARKDGRPVMAKAVLPVRFTLQGSD